MKLTDSEFQRMRDFMYRRFGINLAQKRLLIEGRMATILQKKGYGSFSDFMDHMEKDTTGEDLSLIITRLTTNFTYFYREEHHFDFLKNIALPEILPRVRDNSLGIWSAGCSSGEEPFTIAMLLDDYFGGNKRGMDTRVLATDISDRVLRIAQQGVYPEERMTKIPPTWKGKYFVHKEGPDYEVKPAIKKEVIYRKFNLMEPEFRFKQKFHVIFCRNVMIYFDNETRQALTKRFYDALLPGGYFFIGLSETLGKSYNGFKYVQPSIYQKV